MSLDNKSIANRAFLYGDAVKVFFYVKNGELKLAEECYFFLMASMRKMRMNIPLSYTLEFFQDILHREIIDKGFSNGVIDFIVYRGGTELNAKSETHYYFTIKDTDVFTLNEKTLELDLIKEINVNNNLLSSIKVHSPENIYAEIYAQENDLDDVILLNPNKRIARTIFGNLLFLKDDTIMVPKASEGSYISPLMENIITFIYQNNLAKIDPSELIAFESQKADEILMVSDEKGLFSVSKIRNKTFGNEKFTQFISEWKNKSLDK